LDFNMANLIKAIIGLILFICLAFQAYCLQKNLSRQKYRFWLALRAMVILFLIMALISPMFTSIASTTTTVFLVDCSLSIANKTSQIQQYINTQLKNKKPSDQVGIVSFARDPMVEIPVSQDVSQISLEAKPDPNFTDIHRALEFSQRLFPQKQNKRLILISDGKQNAGNAKEILPSLKADGINIAAVILTSDMNKDVQLTSIKLPRDIRKNQKVPMNVIVDSNYEAEGIFYLFDDSGKVLEKNLYVKQGTNEFNIDVFSKERDYMDFRGEIVFEGDEDIKNNTFSISASVKDVPRVLVLGKNRDTQNLDNILDSLKIKRKNFHPAQVPSSIGFLSQFNEVIMVNTSHDDISYEFEQTLEYCVRELGMGLIVIGGEDTFALGNYKGTLLEKMLPVESSMRGNSKQPNTGLVLAVDCSGSMSEESFNVEKIEMAKEAILNSLDILDERDFVGVLAFSDEVEWIVPLQQLTDENSIKEDIAKLRAKGGTLIIPALEESVRVLKDADAKAKHIILLTDGQAEKEGYSGFMQSIRDQGISLTTVSVGKDSDKELLEALANEAQGRYYHANDVHQIPKIFVRETYLAAKKYLNHIEFVPELVEPTPYLKETALPKLMGYVGTGIKPGAKIVLRGPKDDPILAEGIYGLGKTLAWTSDLNGFWSRNWIGENDLSFLLGRSVDYCMAPHFDDIDIDLKQKGPNVDVFLDVGKIDAAYEIEAILNAPKRGIEKNIKFLQTRAGGFKGSFLLDELGEYILSIKVLKDGKIIKSIARTLYLDYSPEYHLAEDDQWEWIKGILQLDSDIDVFKLPLDEKTPKESNGDLFFLAAALAAFTGDIWLRRRYGNW